MNTFKQTTNPVKVDWIEAKTYYIEDRTKSYSDIARMFGVSLKTVKKHGIREQWFEGRQEVSDSVISHIQEKLVDELEETNKRHREFYKQSQKLIARYFYILEHDLQVKINKAKAENRTMSSRELYSPKQLYFLMKAMRLSTDGERLTLNLPTVVTAPANYQPQPYIDYSKMTVEELELLIEEYGSKLTKTKKH